MASEQQLSDVDFLTKDFHVWPDLHGNRSPLADSTIKGKRIEFIPSMISYKKPKFIMTFQIYQRNDLWPHIVVIR